MEQNHQSKKNCVKHGDSRSEESGEETVPISNSANKETRHAAAATGDHDSSPKCAVSYDAKNILPMMPRLTESTRRAEHMDTKYRCESRDRRSAEVQETSFPHPVRPDALPFYAQQNGYESSFRTKIARAVTEEEHILLLKKAILKRIIQIREDGGDPQSLGRLEAAFELVLEGRTEDVMRCLCGQT